MPPFMLLNKNACVLGSMGKQRLVATLTLPMATPGRLC